MLALVNYATGSFKKTQKFNSWTGKYIAGFDRVFEYDDNDLDDDFKSKNNKALSTYRGGGYVWKPYCILKALDELDEGDILFYCDAGAFFIRSMKKYLINMEGDIWLSNIPFLEKQFSKRKAFEMLGCDEKWYGESNQIQGGFVGIRKNEKSVNFIKEWLKNCENEELLSPDDNYNGQNDPCYIANREDQTIVSLMSKKAGITPHPDPTQYGKLPEEYMRDPRFIISIPEHRELHKTYIILHRTGTLNLKIILKQIFVAIAPRKVSLKIMRNIRS